MRGIIYLRFQAFAKLPVHDAVLTMRVAEPSRFGELRLEGFMYVTRVVGAVLISITASAWAQQSALDLQLPSSVGSPQSSAVAAPAPVATTATTPDSASLPAPYDTTYGDRRDAAENGCVDEAYSKPQVHGSVGMGVAASNRASANYETTEIEVSKPLGSCDDPKGEVSASIRVTKSNFNFRRRNGP